jgi:hypothetical protein
MPNTINTKDGEHINFESVENFVGPFFLGDDATPQFE